MVIVKLAGSVVLWAFLSFFLSAAGTAVGIAETNQVWMFTRWIMAAIAVYYLLWRKRPAKDLAQPEPSDEMPD